MSIVIRAGRRTDLAQVYDVLAAAFTDAPLQLFADQTEADSTLRWKHVRVAEVDGRIAAHVRIFSRRMMVRGVPVAAGGIGSVASHPLARGLGLPTALLHDAIDVMERDGMPVSFLFTGIPAFYERLGWRIARQAGIDVSAIEAASMPHERGYAIRRIADDDVTPLLALYRRATAGSTGAIVRTRQTWRDAQQWLGEDGAGCLVATWAGRPVAYIRSRSRDFGYQVLEAEALRGHAMALPALLARIAKRAASLKQSITTYAPTDSPLADALRTLASTRETADVRYPAMMRIVSLDRLVAALLPQIAGRAERHRGAAFSLGLRAPDEQRLTLEIAPATARVRRSNRATYELDEAGTIDLLLGQRRASILLRPRPAAEVRRRIDGIFPETPFRFWNSDRI